MACRGCAEFSKAICRLVKDNKDDNCPCRVCLVRSMCVDVCSEYQKYVNIDGEYSRYIEDINKIKET